MGAEPSKHGLARDRRTVRSRRASSQRAVYPLGSTNDPAAYREQQGHRGDRQCRRSMVRRLMSRPPKTRQLLIPGLRVDAAAQNSARQIRRQMQFYGDGRAGSPKPQHFRARRRTHQRQRNARRRAAGDDVLSSPTLAPRPAESADVEHRLSLSNVNIDSEIERELFGTSAATRAQCVDTSLGAQSAFTIKLNFRRGPPLPIQTAA